jgi:polyhydroxyalkanoate synthesis repressor PhaR
MLAMRDRGAIIPTDNLQILLPVGLQTQRELAVADETIRIKRYPNRRLYASHTSKYVSLPEIEEMIASGHTVEIVDSQTNEDITRSVLVQIIAERHPDKMAMFPSAMLHAMLRANAVTMNFLQDYFRNSMAYVDYFQKHGASGPLEKPMHWMKAWLDNWSALRPGNPSSPPASDSPADSDQQFAERIARLESRIAELEAEKSKTPHGG